MTDAQLVLEDGGILYFFHNEEWVKNAKELLGVDLRTMDGPLGIVSTDGGDAILTAQQRKIDASSFESFPSLTDTDTVLEVLRNLAILESEKFTSIYLYTLDKVDEHNFRIRYALLK